MSPTDPVLIREFGPELRCLAVILILLTIFAAPDLLAWMSVEVCTP